MPDTGRVESEVTAVFRKFMAAQNAHDIAIVGEIILDSPDFLWITEGTAVRGREAVPADRLKSLGLELPPVAAPFASFVQ